jgi:hypothetical protein
VQKVLPVRVFRAYCWAKSLADFLGSAGDWALSFRLGIRARIRPLESMRGGRRQCRQIAVPGRLWQSWQLWSCSCGAPFGAPAFAVPGNVQVAAIPDSTEVPATIDGGFVQEADVTDGATLNGRKAGAAVPIKFGLGGNRGLDILARERRRRPALPVRAENAEGPGWVMPAAWPRMRRRDGVYLDVRLLEVTPSGGGPDYSRLRRGFPCGEHAPQCRVRHVASKYVVARSVAKCLSDLRTVPVA